MLDARYRRGSPVHRRPADGLDRRDCPYATRHPPERKSQSQHRHGHACQTSVGSYFVIVQHVQVANRLVRGVAETSDGEVMFRLQPAHFSAGDLIQSFQFKGISFRLELRALVAGLKHRPEDRAHIQKATARSVLEVGPEPQTRLDPYMELVIIAVVRGMVMQGLNQYPADLERCLSKLWPTRSAGVYTARQGTGSHRPTEVPPKTSPVA